MLTFKKWLTGCACLLVMGATSLQAQEWEYGAWLGTANYFGDLNTNTSFESTGPAGGLFARYNLSSRFAFKMGANGGMVAFDDAISNYPYQEVRNLSFRSEIVELTGNVEFNFFKYVKHKEQFTFTPYVLTGFSVFYFNPKAKYNGQWHALQKLQTEGEKYSRISFAIAVGGGFKYSFNPFWTIALEIATRKTFTDYLDDVSDVYVADDQLAAGPAQALADRSGEVTEPIGQPGKQRGNVRKNDDYLFIGIGISYTFRTIKCPKPNTIFE